MNSSRFLRYCASVTGVLVAATFALAGKPAPPPPTPIVATTTDRNFLEVDVNKVCCQTEFDLAVSVSRTGTHYRYKVGPAATTIPGELTGYSAPIPKTTPVSFNLTGQADVGYVLCLQGLELDRKGVIKNSQPLSQATAYYWTKDTAPVEFHVTFTGELEEGGYTSINAINQWGTAVGTALLPSQGAVYPGGGAGLTYQHAVRWTSQNGLEDISSLPAPWFDLETDPPTQATGWVFFSANDINGQGQIAGRAWDGNFLRACIYDESVGFRLLPRWNEPAYYEATCWYSARSMNDNGDVCVQMNGQPFKTYVWTPGSPHAIHVIEPASTTGTYPYGIGWNVFGVQKAEPLCVEVYEFLCDGEGGSSYSLLDTVEPSGSGANLSYVNENGAFAYPTDNGTTQTVMLYVPYQGRHTVRQSTGALLEWPAIGLRANDSGDFVYNLDSVPYLYRYGENRSYRLYDPADTYTKSTLFASDNGKLKDATKGVYYAVVSDDDVAGAPYADPFDTLSGLVDTNQETTNGHFVLTPVPRQ